MKKRNLNKELIVEKALELADQDGIDGLSMRKLATTLGITAMALYNHVANKEELIDLLLTEVVKEFHRPQIGANWQTEIRKRAHKMRDALLRHKWAAPLLVSTITLSDEVLSDINATAGCLIKAGFTNKDADWARNAIDSHVYGYTMQEINFPVNPEEYRAAAAQFLPMIDKEKFPYIHLGAKEIIEGRYDGINDFSFGLELLISGIEEKRTHHSMTSPP